MRVKIKKDPRITKIGHFIRKTSIDELPQFFDSFIGTMSVVGPRPQRQFEVDEYNQVFATRLLVKPGITGPWQVQGEMICPTKNLRLWTLPMCRIGPLWGILFIFSVLSAQSSTPMARTE